MAKRATQQVEGETVEVKGAPELSAPLQPSVPESLKKQPVVASKKKKKDPTAFKNMFEKTGKISVKPFVDPNKENMGLEDYGYALFPGTYHEEQLAAIERNGLVRFITGLDEFAPEVQNIKDEEQKEAVIFNIRCVVAHLEKLLATNVLDVEDADFWNKVKLLRPDNFAFWGKISLRCGNEPLHLEPLNDPYDLIKLMAIEAGGFDLIGKSYEDANAQAVAPKFFLDKEVHTVSNRTTYKKLRNRAIGLLDEMYNKFPKKLFYVTKILDTDSATYKITTPLDILYDVMDEFINGYGMETNKSKAAEMFSATAELDMETLKLKAIVKDATFFKFIQLKTDGMLYHAASSTMLGRNVSDVVLYLKNPLNEDVLVRILQEVEDFWKD
jgi:hypothetical protein